MLTAYRFAWPTYTGNRRIIRTAAHQIASQNEDGSYPGADGYPVDDGNWIYAFHPWLPINMRMQRIDYFHGGPFSPIFQTVDGELDMLSTMVINVHPENPTIRRVTMVQRLWRARLQRLWRTRLQNMRQVGILLSNAYFSIAEWTRWRDYHNHRWWHREFNMDQWFHEDLPWLDMHGQCVNSALEHSVLLYQESSGSCMFLWRLLSITANDGTRLVVAKHEGRLISLHAETSCT